MNNQAAQTMPEFRELAQRAIPFLRDEGSNYEDDGNNEPLELARAIEAALAWNPNRDAANPGGCECEKCGRVFIGAEWHVLCGICVDHGVAQPDGSGLRNGDNVSASTPEASPQPQVTNPAYTACNVEGTWLWGKLMDWCRSQGTSPANFDSLFAIASEAHKLYAAAPAASATSKTHDRCTDPENCKRCSEDASTPHAGIPHAAPAASGVDTSTNEAWAERAKAKIVAMDAAASVSERAREIMEVIDSWMSRFDHSRASTCSEHQSETKWELDRSRIQSALEQALTQQRGAVKADPIVIEAVAAIQRNSDGDLYVDWLLEGGIHGLENGDVLMVSATDLTNDEGYGKVYTTPQPGAEALRESDNG